MLTFGVPWRQISDSMKLRAVSPLFPSVVVNIDEHLDNMHDFIDVWCMFCRLRKPIPSELEVELRDRVSPSKFFSLDTSLASVIQDCTKDSLLFSIDYKTAKGRKRTANDASLVQINYLIIGLPEDISTGVVRINPDHYETYGELVEYISARHALICDIAMKTKGTEYLVRECSSKDIDKITVNTGDYFRRIPLNDLDFKRSDENFRFEKPVPNNIVLFDGIRHIVYMYLLI